MANELNFYGDLSQTGLTVIARIYNSAGTQVGSDVNCNESGSLAIYVGDMPTADAGQYGVRFFDNSENLLSQGVINWDGTQEYDLIGSADVSGLATSGEVSGLSVDLTPVINAIDALNDISVSDIEASTVLAKEASLAALAGAVALIPTDGGAVDLSPVITAIGNLNDVTPAEVRAAFNAADFQDKNTEAEVHAWLDTYTNKDNWKADTPTTNEIVTSIFNYQICP